MDTYSPWQNHAESEIREVKAIVGRWQMKTCSPRWLWDYTIKLASLIQSHTAHDMYQLKGEVPETILTGQTAVISHICEFGWYEWVYFHKDEKMPRDKEVLGHYFRPMDPGIGSVMSYHVLKASGQIL